MKEVRTGLSCPIFQRNSTTRFLFLMMINVFLSQFRICFKIVGNRVKGSIKSSVNDVNERVCLEKLVPEGWTRGFARLRGYKRAMITFKLRSGSGSLAPYLCLKPKSESWCTICCLRREEKKNCVYTLSTRGDKTSMSCFRKLLLSEVTWGLGFSLSRTRAVRVMQGN